MSDAGRVRSERRSVRCHDGRRLSVKQRILRPGTHHSGGYLQLTLSRGAHREYPQIQVLVLAAFVGPRPAGMEACHNNGDPRDNRLINLRWDTPGSNTLDQVAHGTHPFASRTHCPRQHTLEPPNLVPSLWAKRGYRDCLACNRARTFANNRRRRTGEVIDWEPLADSYYADLVLGSEAA